MKYLTIVLVLLCIIAGCATRERNEAPQLVGNLERGELEHSYPWFEKNYRAYNPDKEKVALIKEKKEGLRAIVFLGTWCGDSKREVPRFYKIAEMADFSDFVVFGVDRKKKSPEGAEKGYGIEYVPTFIFFKGDKEIGRIIEKPKKTIEDDMLAIFTR